MARQGRVDRGLMMKKDAAGKPVWYVRLYHEGKERRFGSFPTKTKAREFYEKTKLEQKEGRFFPERYHSVGYELVQDVLDRHMRTRADKKDQRGERRFCRWWREFFKEKRLNAVTPSALEEARQTLLATGCSPQTVNRYLAWMRHVLNVAIRDGKLRDNAATKLPMFKEPKGKTRFLTVDEETKLCHSLGAPYSQWVRFALLTGLRRAEQFALRWMDVDFERGILTLPATKAGGVQHVPLNAEAQAILRAMDSWQRSTWVFPSRNPATHVDPCNFYQHVFLPAVKRLGLQEVTWHTLRHTFASRLAMSGATDYDIASCLRHSTTALVRRYAHLSPTHLRGVMERVSAFGKDPGKEESKTVSEGVSQNGTVTKFGITGESPEGQDAQPVEKTGAGDPA